MQGPGQTGQRAAEHDHAQHQGGGVDAQGVEHVAVLRGGFDLLAPARACEQQVQPRPHQRAQRHAQQLPARKLRLPQADRALQARKAGGEHLLRAKPPEHGVVHRQRQAKGGHQLVQLGGTAHAAQQQPFHQRPAQPGQRRPQQHGRRVAQRRFGQPGPPVHQRVRRHQSAQHEKTAVRKVDDAGDAKNQRQPAGHQKQGAGVAQAAQQLQGQAVKVHVGVGVRRTRAYSTNWVNSAALTRLVWKVLTRAASSA